MLCMSDKRSYGRIALIIIDQLRYDYAEYFSDCSRLCKTKTKCDTNSIPTSTEAMHANIALGKYPCEHGVFSKQSKDAKDIEVLAEMYATNALSSLASIGYSRGYKTFFAGGKKDVADIVATDLDSDLRVFGEKQEGHKWKLDSNNYEGSYWEKEYSLWHDRNPFIFSPAEMDCCLLSLLKDVLVADRNKNNGFFYVVALPGLDFIGHKWGPHSSETISHIKDIDRTIADLIESNDDVVFIIAGDHGCRNTDKYVIQRDDNDRIAGIYHKAGEIYKPAGVYEFADNFQFISFDGGKLRLWLHEGCDLSAGDMRFFSDYGKIIDLRHAVLDNVEPRFREIIENSRHTNAGDVIVVSNEDSTFCKRTWINEAKTRKKISNQQDLELYELPRGEHGTYYDKDRLTLLLSTQDFKKESFLNLDIRQEIEKLMDCINGQKE